jgi:PadR family transcriptional regulator PadR
LFTQFKKGTLELCVLALLYEVDRYGYELVSMISEEIEVTAGTIYPLLKRILEDGCVETETRDSPEGPSRKYYRLTERGRGELLRSVREWRSFSVKMNKMIGGIPL